jgi:hypothetical protein
MSSKYSYSSIPETKIVSSFKRFVNEKRKNQFQGQMNSSSMIPTDDTSITYQSQIISCYYLLDDQQQEQFWSSLDIQTQDPEAFYYEVLKKIQEQFGISRNSKELEKYLLDQVIYAYNDDGERIYIKDIIRFDDSQHVCLGMMTKSSPSMCSTSEEKQMWMVKWNVDPKVGEDLTSMAFSKWDMISDTGAEIPKILKNFYILDFPVVVMESLEPLDASDYNQKLVLSIISYIEKIISIGVNNNIKPSNLLKKIKEDQIQYFVVDAEKMAIEEKDYGFQRFSWTSEWASQVIDSQTITTVKNDLLEFGYTLHFLSQMNEITDAEMENRIINQIRISEMPDELLNWMNRVRLIDEQDIKLNDFIDLKKLSLGFPKNENKISK